MIAGKRSTAWLVALVALAGALGRAPDGAAQDEQPPAACMPAVFALEPGGSKNLTLSGWLGLGVRDGLGGQTVSGVSGQVAPDDGSLVVGTATYQDGRAALPLTAGSESEGRSYRLTIAYKLTTVTWVKEKKQVTTRDLTCRASVVVALRPLALATWVEGTAKATLRGDARVTKVSPRENAVSRQTHVAGQPQVDVLGTKVGADDYSVTYRIGGWTGQTRLDVTVVDRKSQYLELEVTVVEGQTADVRLPGPPEWSQVQHVQSPPAPAIARLLVFAGAAPASDAVKVDGVKAGMTEALVLYKRRQVADGKVEPLLVRLVIKVVAPPEPPRQADQPPPKR